jgi:hypothetical protein
LTETFNLRWNAKQRHLTISLLLLEQLGSPAQLVLYVHSNGRLYLLLPGDERVPALQASTSIELKARKVNYPQVAMPRLSIGDPDLCKLLRDGRYRGWVKDSAIAATFAEQAPVSR